MTLHRETLGAGGPPLVCLHGWGLNLRVFDALARGLNGERQVIAIDLPGHGASPWDPLRSSFEAQSQWLLEALPERCVLLGWSLGGQLALELARRAPERIQRLVLLATTPRFACAPDWPQGMAGPALERFAAHLRADWQGTVRDFLALQVRGSRDAAAALAMLEQALGEHGQAQPAALAAGLEILRSVDLRLSLPALDVPSLVITGQHDRITPPAAGLYLAGALRGARHVELARAGHAPHLSPQVEVARLVREFLAAA